jgi:hypothetical protein
VAEEGWAGVSDARQPDAARTDAEGFRGAVGLGTLPFWLEGQDSC